MSNTKEIQTRKFSKKGDAVILGVLLLCCLGVFLFLRSRPQGDGSNVAVLSVDGKVVAAYHLGEHTAHEIVDLKELTGVSAKLEFDHQRVRFIQVDCPDKICEHVGYIQDDMQSAICLPNKMSLVIYSPKEYENLKKQEK